MNNDIPTLWFVVSGLFFFLGIVVMGAMLYALLKLAKAVEEMKPRVVALTVKVDALVDKVDRVADRVEETLVSVRGSVDGVGGSAKGILGAIEHVAVKSALKLDAFTPILAGAMAAFRIFQAYKAHKDHAKPAASPKPLPAGKKAKAAK